MEDERTVGFWQRILTLVTRKRAQQTQQRAAMTENPENKKSSVSRPFTVRRKVHVSMDEQVFLFFFFSFFLIFDSLSSNVSVL